MFDRSNLYYDDFAYAWQASGEGDVTPLEHYQAVRDAMVTPMVLEDDKTRDYATYRVGRTATHAHLPDLPSNEIKIRRVEDPKTISRASNFAVGVEEVWIGPKGQAARARRKREERSQLKLLQQAVAFGSGEQPTGLASYNIPERIQEYRWVSSSSFSCGWCAESGRQGELSYSIQAPISSHQFAELRRNIGQNTLYDTKTGNVSQLFKLRIFEGIGEWHVRNNGVDPAELTVWKLVPREKVVLTSLQADTGDAWFPYTDNGEATGTGFLSNGLFAYETNGPTVGSTTRTTRVPVFDQTLSTSPLTVNDGLPVCMARSFNSATAVNFGNVANSAVAPSNKDYFNSPMDYPAIAQNFHVFPAYHRWMKAGDYSVLKAAMPYAVTLGYQQDYQQTPLPTNDGTFRSPADEEWKAWNKTWGPLYLFRVRGAVCYDGTFPPETKSYYPQQVINFGSAVLNVVFKSTAYACLDSYPDEFYQYRNYLSNQITAYDQMNFANEVQSAPVAPANVTGSVPP